MKIYNKYVKSRLILRICYLFLFYFGAIPVFQNIIGEITVWEFERYQVVPNPVGGVVEAKAPWKKMTLSQLCLTRSRRRTISSNGSWLMPVRGCLKHLGYDYLKSPMKLGCYDCCIVTPKRANRFCCQ